MVKRKNVALLSAMMAALSIWLCVGASAFILEGREVDRAMREREQEMGPPALPGASYATQVFWGEKASKSADRADRALHQQFIALFAGVVAPIALALFSGVALRLLRKRRGIV